MYNGIGLTSVRGSGTNGYVTKNMAHVSRQRTARAKSVDAAQPAMGTDNPLKDPHRANTEILDHNRKREVEVKCLKLSVSLEDQGVPEDEIERKVSALRTSLLAKLPALGAGGSSGGAGGRAGETHSDAAAKAAESAALMSALGIKGDYQSGSAFDRELQAKLKEERMAKRAAEEEAKLEAEAELEREMAREEKRKRKEARRDEKEEKRKRRKEEKREARERSAERSD